MFFSPFGVAVASLGEGALRAFVRFVLVWVSSTSCGLGRAAVCDCGTPWTFLLPFLSVSFSSWCLGRAVVCDCDTPWTFLLPFFICCVSFTIVCCSALLLLVPRKGYVSRLWHILGIHTYILSLFASQLFFFSNLWKAVFRNFDIFR